MPRKRSRNVKLKLGELNRTARTEGVIRPSGLINFCLPTVLCEWNPIVRSLYAFETWVSLHEPKQQFTFSFSFFFFFFSFPLLSSLNSPSAGCWNWGFEGVRVPGLKKLKLGSCPDRPRALPTSAGSCVPRFLLNWRANFCIFNFVSSSPHLFLVKVGMIYT